MKTSKLINYNYALLLAAFLIGGLLHVALYGVDFTTCIVQIYYGAVLCIWCWTIWLRISDRRVCLSLLGIGSLSVLMFVLQMGKYSLFQTSALACRQLWYGYYISMIGIPILLLLMAICMDLPEEEKADKRFPIVVVLGILLMIGFLTNDLHGLALYTPGGVLDESHYSHGVLYYLYVVFVVLVSITAFVIILRKCRLSAAKKRSWMVPVVVLIGTAGLISVIFEMQPRIGGITVWRMAEMYVFMSVLTLEVCIHIGMIPCNVEYGSLFRKMKLPIEIRDQKGNCLAATEEAIEESEQVWVRSMPINGGYVSWSVDMTKVYALNQELEEATEQIAARNQYLQTKNSIQEEQAVLDVRNRLYQQISQILRPQLDKIEMLLQEDSEENFLERLAKITVLNAYVKRRSHLELLREENEYLPIDELRLAIAESAQYLQLCKIDVALAAFDVKELPSGIIILLYEFFETVLEKCLGDAPAMLVTVGTEAHSATLRILIQADTFSAEIPVFDGSDGYHKKLNVTKQGADTVLAFSVSEGGANQ